VIGFGMNSNIKFKKPEKPYTVFFSIGERIVRESKISRDPSRNVPKSKIIIYNQTIKMYFTVVRFGCIEAMSYNDVNEYFSNLGPDCLREEITKKQFKRIMREKKIQNWNLNKLLLDQNYFLSTVGNYLVSSILYEAKLSPYRIVKDLTKKEIAQLLEASNRVPKESLAAGGLTIESFFSPSGREGVYDSPVYGKSKDPLGNRVIKEYLVEKRPLYWVKKIQK